MVNQTQEVLNGAHFYVSLPKTGDLVLFRWVKGSFTRCVTAAPYPGVAQEVPEQTSLQILHRHLLHKPDGRRFDLVIVLILHNVDVSKLICERQKYAALEKSCLP